MYGGVCRLTAPTAIRDVTFKVMKNFTVDSINIVIAFMVEMLVMQTRWCRVRLGRRRADIVATSFLYLKPRLERDAVDIMHVKQVNKCHEAVFLAGRLQTYIVT